MQKVGGEWDVRLMRITNNDRVGGGAYRSVMYNQRSGAGEWERTFMLGVVNYS